MAQYVELVLIAAVGGGFYILDIRDPYHLKQVGYYPTNGYAKSIIAFYKPNPDKAEMIFY